MNDAMPSMADPPFAVAPDIGPEPVTVVLAGNPRGKERARATRNGHHYTPKATRTYEADIRIMAQQAMGGRRPFDCPVEFVMRAVFEVPPSWSKKKQAAALCGLVKPTVKPDWDNISKAWNDALNGVVYRDDSLVVKASVEKRYGPAPLVVATVRAVP